MYRLHALGLDIAVALQTKNKVSALRNFIQFVSIFKTEYRLLVADVIPAKSTISTSMTPKNRPFNLP
jgi:hypothetical protein